MKQTANTLGSLIDKLNAIREEKRAHAEVEKEINKRYAEVEAAILATLEEQGMDKASAKTATVSVSYNTIANVTDWDKVYALIKKHNAFHLMQKRISDPAFRELYEIEYNKLASKRGFDPEKLDPATVVPGFVPFVKKSLNLRTI